MALPTIQLDQPTPGPGTPGVSRVDFVLGEVISISDPANGAGSYTFSLVGKPAASLAVLNNPTTATPTITPDVWGNYLIRERFVDADGIAWEATIVAGVQTVNNQWVLPAPGETLELGPDGWSPYREAIILDIDTGFCTGFLDLAPNSALGVGSSGKARIKYDESVGVNGEIQVSLNGQPYAPLGGGGGGGPGSDTTAIHVNSPNEIAGIVSTGTLATGDYFVTEDIDDSNAKKRRTISDIVALIPGGTDADAIHDNVPNEIAPLATPVGGLASTDVLLVEDASAGNAKRMATVQDVIDIVPASGGGGPAVGGLTGWEKVKTVEVSGSPASSILFDSLDGNLHEEYRIVLSLIWTDPSDSVARDLLIVPNGTTANNESYVVNGNGTSSSENRGTFGFVFDPAGGGLNGTVNAHYDLTYFASPTPDGSAVTRFRKWHARGYVDNITGDSRRLQVSSGTWLDNTTNLTSLEIQLVDDGTTSLQSELAPGTVATLYKRAVGAAAVTGGLEFMDEIIVTGAAVQTVQFGPSGDGDFLRTLDGDTDEEYLVVGNIIKGAAAASYSLQPNGSSANQEVARIETIDGAAPSADTQTALILADPGSLGDANETVVTFEATLFAKTGAQRGFRSLQGGGDLTGGVTGSLVGINAGILNDLSTNIVSLDIVGSVASAIGVGSRIRLFRRVARNVRADSANTVERQTTAVVSQGTSAEVEFNVGRVSHTGSLVAFNTSINDTISSGTITARIKIGGTTKLTIPLTSGSYGRQAASIGAIPVLPGDEILVSLETSSLVTSGAGSVGVVLTATLTAEAFVQPPVETNAVSNLWAIPASPHVNDVEFNAAGIPSGWAFDPTEDATAIDAYASFAGPGVRHDVNTRKRSWLSAQPPADGAIYYFHKPITVPTNLLVYARLAFRMRFTSVQNNDHNLGLMLCASSAGAPDFTNSAVVYLPETDSGTVGTQLGIYNNSGSSVVIGQSTILAVTWAYVALHKLGSSIHAWQGTDAATWRYIGSGTYTGNPFDRVALWLQNVSSASPGNMILTCDFIRFIETDDFPF